MDACGDTDSPVLRTRIYRLYRDFLDLAEKRRRWSLRDDIPWQQCNSSLPASIADVVESFCAVELYLPDYMSQILPHIRANRGRAWFTANWGYEESKHSLALGDWLLRSGLRSEEQMADLENTVFEHQWNLPLDSVRGMVCYSMVQEVATWLHYRNLRQVVGAQGDPALYRLLGLISVDERAHFDFFRTLVQLHLEEDRPGTLEQLRRVLNHFSMPAIYALADGRRRMEAVKSLRIFDDNIFYQDVYLPVLAALGVERAEMRNRVLYRKTLRSPPSPVNDRSLPAA
jgi:acyl-[acyl-carrier-protein] desaturase